jgi:hypothetical protein
MRRFVANPIAALCRFGILGRFGGQVKDLEYSERHKERVHDSAARNQNNAISFSPGRSPAMFAGSVPPDDLELHIRGAQV